MVNYISNVPPEISIQIFPHLDEASLIKCATVDKKIHQFIFSVLLNDLKLPPSEDPYREVMMCHKMHCHFFIKKLPTSFEMSERCLTITEMKRKVDCKLAAFYDSIDVQGLRVPYLKEIWTRFMNQVDPFVKINPLAIDMRPKPNMHFNDEVLDPNQEVSIFLRAGAYQARFYRDVLGSIIKKSWCTLETVQLLLAYKFDVTLDTVLFAIGSTKFETELPNLINSMKLEQDTLYELCKIIPPTHKFLLEDSFKEREYSASNNDILGLLEKKYSKELISKILKQCTEGIGPDTIERALKDRYSNDLVLKLLEKCPYSTYESLVKIAVDDGYYSHALIERLLEKLPKSRLQNCLEETMRRHFYPELVSKFLHEAEGAFSPWVFRISNSLERVLQIEYPEEVVIEIVDHLETVQPGDIVMAKQMNYSENLIQKMQVKVVTLT